MQISHLFNRLPTGANSLHGFGHESQEQEQPGMQRFLYLLLLVSFLSMGYYYFIVNKALVEMEIQTQNRTVLKFYWPDELGLFNEGQMAQLIIKPGKTSYKIRVTDMAAIPYLRLDPSEKTGWINIKRLTLTQSGYPPYQLQTANDFKNLQAISGVDTLRGDKHGLKFHVNNRDPQFKLLLPEMGNRSLSVADFGSAITLFLLVTGCYFLFQSFFQSTYFIPTLGAFSLALILVMAGISGFNTHPDEFVHVAAGEFYENHSIPPKIGDPAIRHTYSVYGVSRLHSGEIVYLVAGKFLKIFQPLHIPSFLLLRLFNALLFTILVLYAFNKVDFRYFLLPCLISPQIWYIFSYCNSEAFAVFISLLAAYQLAAEKSAFTAMLRGEESKYSGISVVLLGILFGLLLMQKLNFYFLYLFFLFYFIWKFRMDGRVWSKKTVYRFCAVVLIGCSVFIAFRGTDAWVNDFNKKELLFEARENYAREMYNPKTPLDKRHAYLQMKERGKTLKHMLQLDRWGEKTFRTSFGVYGYAQYPGTFSYYEYVRLTGVLLLLSLVVSVVCKGGISGIMLLALSLGWTMFFLGGLIQHAWTADFQAQGRYLLPVLPVLAILLYHCQKLINKPIFYSLFLISFLLSVYNFIFVGLRDIGKYGI